MVELSKKTCILNHDMLMFFQGDTQMITASGDQSVSIITLLLNRFIQLLTILSIFWTMS